jgi:endonuclease/exonuclease/phosphatase family metal-dependent hydrolase
MATDGERCRRTGRSEPALLRVSFLLWFFVLFVANAFAAAGGTLTVATYNVENYNSADRQTEAGYRPEYPKPEAQKTALRDVIRRLNADVLALQEMGGAPYLEELRRDLKTEGLDYPFGAVLEADGLDPDRHVAVLSKRPFVSVVRHTDLVAKFSGTQERVKRGLLEVRIAVRPTAAASSAGSGPAGPELAAGGAEWTLFVMHLKSRLTERADDPESATQRAAEAEAVRDRVLKIFPDPAAAKFLVLGDANTGRADRPLRALQARGRTAIAEWLPAADSRGEVWSYFYAKADTYDRVDHILASPALRTAVVTTRIEDGPGVKEASDHRPVVVTLRTE